MQGWERAVAGQDLSLISKCDLAVGSVLARRCSRRAPKRSEQRFDERVEAVCKQAPTISAAHTSAIAKRTRAYTRSTAESESSRRAKGFRCLVASPSRVELHDRTSVPLLMQRV